MLDFRLSPEDPAAAAALPAGHHVLVVEDSPGDASLVGALLVDAGLTWSWVERLADAREAMRAGGVDCVLLDLGLPDGSGLETVAAIRGCSAEVPVVVLTGRADSALGLAAVGVGADDYLSKGDLPSATVARSVLYAVERRRVQAALAATRAQADAVLAAVEDGIVVHALDGRVTLANPAATRLLGLDRAALDVPMRVADRWRAVGGAAEEHPVDVTARTGQPSRGRLVRVGGPDGAPVLLEVNSHPLYGDGTRMSGVVASFRDVTERHRAEGTIRFHAALLDAVGQAVTATDADGTVRYWNRPAEALYGVPTAAALGRPIEEVMEVVGPGTAGAAAAPPLWATRAWCGELVVRRPDESTIDALSMTTPLRDAGGEVTGFITVATDITERKRTEVALSRLSAIVEHTADAVVGTDVDGAIVSWNRGAGRLYRYRAAHVVGRHVSMLADPGQVAGLRAVLEQVSAGETVQEVESTHRRADGTAVAVSLTVSPVYDDAGALIGASAIVRDVTERKRMEQELQRQALHDALTGLPNRTLLGDRLRQALATLRRRDGSLALLFLDLDDFKLINDAAGHLAGDQLLVQVAERLVASVRPHDTVARFGGDEFVVVCEDADQPAAEQLAARISDALRAPFRVAGRDTYVTATIGIAVAPPADPESLLRHADAAMYEAKARGRAGARVFDVALADRAREELAMSHDLREAIANDGLGVCYQPVIDLRSSAVVGVEALVRWRHPVHGPIPPLRFVDLAERTGLVNALDLWVLRQACEGGAALREAHALPPDAYVAVNVSGLHVAHGGLERAVQESALQHGLPLTALRLEITETALMADPDAARTVLDRLRELGVSVAIDDFGTGYSSLAYLRRFPVVALKIDRSFVEHIDEDPDDLAVAASIVDLGRAVGVEAVAEGVEHVGQLDLLRRVGCPAAQGFLFAPPLPRAELTSLLLGNGGRFAVAARPDTRRRPRRAPAGAGAVTPAHGLTRMMQLHREGASLQTIAAALNAEGFRTPDGLRWHRNTVAHAVSSVAYPSLWRRDDGAAGGPGPAAARRDRRRLADPLTAARLPADRPPPAAPARGLPVAPSGRPAHE